MPTNAIMGVTVLASDGGAYSTGTFDNLKYTTTDGSTFSTTTAPSLVSAEAKAAAYYPWADGTDITAVPVTTAAQTDYMYSGWYTGLKDSNPQAKFNMKHALAAVRIGVQKSAGYTPTATLTAVSATSDAFYASATLDATSSTGTLSGLTGPGAVLEKTSLSQALSTTPYTTDFLVVPGTSAQTITFTVTIGGSEYTATTAAATLQQGAIHSYTLTLSAEGLTVTGTTVEPWTTINKGTLTLEKYDPWSGLANGVYAVSADGKPVTYSDADESCIAVALIVNDAPTPQRLMIEKTQSYDATNTTFYWGKNLWGKDVAGITEISTGSGYLPKANGSYYSTPILSSDYTTWTSGGLSDFNGKNNTNAIITAYTEHSVSMNAQDMCKVLQTFNAGTYGSNQGFTDWYIPACGQLALIYLNKTAINEALTAIGGTTFSDLNYWSSSEYSYSYSWIVSFDDGIVFYDGKDDNDRVRFVRDF